MIDESVETACIVVEEDFGTRGSDVSSEGFEAATIIDVPRGGEMPADDGEYPGETDCFGTCGEVELKKDADNDGTDISETGEDKLNELEPVKGLEVVDGYATRDGGFIMEDGSSMSNWTFGFTVEDGLALDFGLRESDLKKLVIELEGRRRLDMLNDSFDDCVVESSEDDELESENEIAEGSVAAAGSDGSTESSSTSNG